MCQSIGLVSGAEKHDTVTILKKFAIYITTLFVNWLYPNYIYLKIKN